jgi:hypothetical protein
MFSNNEIVSADAAVNIVRNNLDGCGLNETNEGNSLAS